MARLTVKKLKQVLSKGKDINCFISDRSGWKSSTVQQFFIDEALKGHPFILVRSKSDEIISESWLSSYVAELAQAKGYTFWSEQAEQNITAIYFNDEHNEKHLYCYGLYLSLAEKYKSNYFKGFEKVRYLLWEECVPNKQLTQSVKHIIARNMQQLIDVVSIGSTVARVNKLQYIFLGNDISVNLLNPITISFNLLERLEANCEIVDTCEIDDRRYTYYFNYFDFDGAVNHWLTNKELDISNDVDIKGCRRYPFILVTQFNKYYVYNCGKFLYITPIRKDEIQSVVTNAREFFALYGAEHLLDEYPVSTALIMLNSFYNVSTIEIERYFGDYYYTGSAIFSPSKVVDENHIINIEEICTMKLASLMTLNNFGDIMSLNELIKVNNVIYTNIKVKLELEKLQNTLLFV